MADNKENRPERKRKRPQPKTAKLYSCVGLLTLKMKPKGGCGGKRRKLKGKGLLGIRRFPAVDN